MVGITLCVVIYYLWRAAKIADDYNSIPTTYDSTNGRVSSTASRFDGPVIEFVEAYKTPIEFYGKVVDQHGDPVSGAVIKIYPVDNPYGSSGTEIDLISDGDGLFSINRTYGLSIGVVVAKKGYLALSDRGLEEPASSRSIDFGLSASKGRRFKDPTSPTLFTLHRIGPVEPLVYIDEKSWRLAVDGTLRKIALDSEDGIGPHQIEFRFNSKWNQLPKGNDRYGKHYDWNFEVRIPGGGLIKNNSDYTSEAPESGYVEEIVFKYSATMPRKEWKRSRCERYFVKFVDGTYGRVRFAIDSASDDGPLSMTSWMNLKPGSRNLASTDKDNFVMPEN